MSRRMLAVGLAPSRHLSRATCASRSAHLRANRLRSFLTLIGIVVGVAP